MSWAEIKKAVNSDLNVPFNHLMWINDLITCGQNGYVAKDSNMVNDLLSSGLLLKNDVALGEYVKLFPNEAKKLYTNSEFMKNISSQTDIVANLLKDQNFITELFKNADSLKYILSNLKTARLISYEPELLKRIFNDSRVTDFILSTDKLLFYLLSDNHIVSINMNATGYNYENSVVCLLKSEVMKNALWEKRIRLTVSNYVKYKSGAFLFLDTSQEKYCIDIHGTIKNVDFAQPDKNKYYFMSQNPYIVCGINYVHEHYFTGMHIYKLD